MRDLELRENCLGFELHDRDHLVALYRVREELPRVESPKPCFAPIYTPSKELISEYRPVDHPWHTGLYFGWVHANNVNLWGGPLYNEESGKYEYVDDSHGEQRHDGFARQTTDGKVVEVEERITWLDPNRAAIAQESRTYGFRKTAGGQGYLWTVTTTISPTSYPFMLGASRKSGYSGFELRMGPPFVGSGAADEGALHRSSEGLTGHAAIMGQRARWVSAEGVRGGAVVMMDHPENPRHPVTWFTRFNLLGAALLMSGDLELVGGRTLDLKYGFAILETVPTKTDTEILYQEYLAG